MESEAGVGRNICIIGDQSRDGGLPEIQRACNYRGAGKGGSNRLHQFLMHPLGVNSPELPLTRTLEKVCFSDFTACLPWPTPFCGTRWPKATGRLEDLEAGQWDPPEPQVDVREHGCTAPATRPPPVPAQLPSPMGTVDLQVREPRRSHHRHIPLCSFYPSLWLVTIKPISQTNYLITTKAPG